MESLIAPKVLDNEVGEQPVKHKDEPRVPLELEENHRIVLQVWHVEGPELLLELWVLGRDVPPQVGEPEASFGVMRVFVGVGELVVDPMV